MRTSDSRHPPHRSARHGRRPARETRRNRKSNRTMQTSPQPSARNRTAENIEGGAVGNTPQKYVVSIEPLSLNSCYRGRRFITPEYKAWREETLWKLKGHPTFVEKTGYELHIIFYRKTLWNWDCSNCVKTFEDSLVKAGIIPDDSYIVKLTIEKRKGDPRIEYTINPST
jgi:Holliday junction resolvase RusA-like endonuclease